MGSPRPVPPYRRVVEVSACAKASNIWPRFSAGMPIPVSVTSNENDADVTLCSIICTRTPTSPRSVNLTALPIKFVKIWRRRPGSPTSAVGRSAGNEASKLQAFAIGQVAESFCCFLHNDPQVERAALELNPSGFDLREIEDFVDNTEKCLGRTLRGFHKALLFRLQLGLTHEFQRPEYPVQRRSHFMAHVRQELRLDPDGSFQLYRPLLDPCLESRI